MERLMKKANGPVKRMKAGLAIGLVIGMLDWP
jgi:hypothetical protein